MAKEDIKTNAKSSSIDNALQRFSDMLIQRMEALTKDWKKGWTGGGSCFGLPQNLTGRTYEGSNAFLLQLHTAMNSYHAPVYMTFLQAKNAGVRINKDEKAIPVFKWGLSIKDENGKHLSESDYRKLSMDEQARCKVHPYLKVFAEWNIDQTNLADVNKERYDALVARFENKQEETYTGDMYVNKALDRMMERQEWVCPIQYDQEARGAFYTPVKDMIVLPLKSQFHLHPDDLEESFKDGQEYYGTALHEMAHSTGHESRLNRLKPSAFGSPEYAKEELVAELTSAMVGNSLGFDRRISDNNAAYLKSWIKVLKEEPKFIVSVMSDVNKASRMVIEHIDQQRIALGEKPLMQGSLDGVEEKTKNEQQLEDVKSAPKPSETQTEQAETPRPEETEEEKQVQSESSFKDLPEDVATTLKQKLDKFIQQMEKYGREESGLKGEAPANRYSLTAKYQSTLGLWHDICKLFRDNLPDSYHNKTEEKPSDVSDKFVGLNTSLWWKDEGKSYQLYVNSPKYKGDRAVFHFAAFLPSTPETILQVKQEELVKLQDESRHIEERIKHSSGRTLEKLQDEQDCLADAIKRLQAEIKVSQEQLTQAHSQSLTAEETENAQRQSDKQDTTQNMKKNPQTSQGEFQFDDEIEQPEKQTKQTTIGNITVPEEAFIGEPKKNGERYVAFMTDYLEANLQPDGSVDFFVPCTDEHAETQDRIVKAMEQKGYKPDLTGERGYVINFDTYEEAKKAAGLVRELNLNKPQQNQATTETRQEMKVEPQEHNEQPGEEKKDTPHPADLIRAYASGDEERIKKEEARMHIFLADYVKKDKGFSYQNFFGYKTGKYGNGNKEFSKFIADTLKNEMLKAGYPKEMFSTRESTRLKLAQNTTDPKVLDVMFADRNEKIKNAIIANPHTGIETYEHEVERSGKVDVIDELAMDEHYDVLREMAGKTKNEKILWAITQFADDEGVLRAIRNPAISSKTLQQIQPWSEELELHDRRGYAPLIVAEARRILQEREANLPANEQIKEEAQQDKPVEGHAVQQEENCEKPQEEKSTQPEQEEKEEQQKESKPVPSKSLAQATILMAALDKVQEQNGVWMNKDCKGNASFLFSKTPISAYNNLMMNLQSDLKGYKTNVYTHYNTAKDNGIDIKRGEKSLPFRWTTWDYRNVFKPEDIISQQTYDQLKGTDKTVYVRHASRLTQSIFNVDQTTLPSKDQKAYSALLSDAVKQSTETKQNPEATTYKQFQDLKQKHPDALLLFRNRDFYEAYNEDAAKAGKLLGLVTSKPKNGEMQLLTIFPHYALDTYLPKLVRAGQRVAICDAVDSTRLSKAILSPESFLAQARASAQTIAKESGMKFETVKVMQDASYDQKEDKIIISSLKPQSVGSEKTAALSKAQDIYRVIVASLGTENRLDRSGRNNYQPEEAGKYDKLIQELASGIMMARQGLPASISKDNQKLIPFWKQELSQHPKLMDVIERDVNNAVETMDNLLAKRKVDYEAIRGLVQNEKEEEPETSYSIVSRLAEMPNREAKEFILIKDKENKRADVIMPEGAILLYTNDNKEAYNMANICMPLGKEDIEDITFHRHDSDIMKQPNEYFRNKDVSLGQISGDSFIVKQEIDVSREANRGKPVDILKFQAIKDDNGRYAFFIKPKDEPSFSVYPPKEHMNTFFKVLNTPEQKAVHATLSKKWYDIATQKPEIKVDLITPRKVDVDESRIVRPTITSSAQDRNQKIVMAIIDGKREVAPISKQQWNRMWLADDMAEYKKAIAAVVFEPLLKQTVDQQQEETKATASRGFKL